MTNINKILITVVACVFMICIASVSIVSIVTSDKEETTTTAAVVESTSDNNFAQSVTPGQQTQQTTSATPAVKPQTGNSSAASNASTESAAITTTSSSSSSSSTTSPSSSSSSTTSPSSSSTTSSSATGDLSTDLLGLWTDSAGMSGYEFLEGGKFNWTYVDLAQFGVPFNGKTSGVYTLQGDKLTIKYSIYSATIDKTYKISISGNELSMYDLEEFETSTYVRVS